MFSALWFPDLLLFTDFFKGNWTLLALVDRCAFQKSPICCHIKKLHIEHICSHPNIRSLKSAFSDIVVFLPLWLTPTRAAQPSHFAFPSRSSAHWPVAHGTVYFVCLRKDSDSLPRLLCIWCFCPPTLMNSAFFYPPPKKKKLTRAIFLCCQTTIIILVSHVDQVRFTGKLPKMNDIMNYVLLLERHRFFFCHVL